MTRFQRMGMQLSGILHGWIYANLCLRELPSDYKGLPRNTYGREVFYDIPDPTLKQATQWLIGNPNRINLGRIGLQYKGDTLQRSEIANSRQELELWSGTLTSLFEVAGTAVKVVTQGDLDSDAVAIRIDSELILSGDLQVELDFPYPPIHSTKYKYEVFAGVYDFPRNHTTIITGDGVGRTSVHIQHVLQKTTYFVNLRWSKQTPLRVSSFASPNPTAVTAHRYTLASVSNTTSLAFTAHFSPDRRIPSSPSKIGDQSRRKWNAYWNMGGFVDMTASSNPNATELQRRIITSQYHVRVNNAGSSQPPQESGLMNNGWYGTSDQKCIIPYNGKLLQTINSQKHSSLTMSRKISHGDGHMAPRSLVDLGKTTLFR
jgi:hypothetical protein